MTAALDEQTWDIVISDYSMPHFSGLAALMLLKERGLDLPFIILSGARQVGLEITAQLDRDILLRSIISRAIELLKGTRETV